MGKQPEIPQPIEQQGAYRPDEQMPGIKSLDRTTSEVEREDHDSRITAGRPLGSQQLRIAQLIASCGGMITLYAAHDHQLSIAFHERQAGEQEHREPEQPDGWPVRNRRGASNHAQRVETCEDQDVQQRHSLQLEGISDRQPEGEKQDSEEQRGKRPREDRAENNQGGSHEESVAERQPARGKGTHPLLWMTAISL